MDTLALSDWLKIALVGWVAISLLAAPLVGRFVAGALHERDEPRRAGAARIRSARATGSAGATIAAPTSRP